MEVITTTTTSNNNNNNNNNNNPWGLSSSSSASYLRSTSLLSLVSAANSESDFSLAEASFHSCYAYEPYSDDTPTNNTNTMMSSSRVPSSAYLLEDVMEEDASIGMEEPHSSSSSNSSSTTNLPKLITGMDATTWMPPKLSLVPLQSFSQLQQQPLSPQLTAARLALSSDIGVLRRSLDSDSSDHMTPYSPTKKQRAFSSQQSQQQHQHHQRSGSPSTPSAELAKEVLWLEREHMLSSTALPMSRSFATPRAAVGTVFRPSLSGTSLSSLYTTRTNSFCSMKEFDTATTPSSSHTSSMSDVPPSLSAEDDVYQPRMDIIIDLPVVRPACLEDVVDDVQIHILQFLELKDIRSLMATNVQFRKLLFTQDAQILWKEWCSLYHWQQVEAATADSESELLLVDDLSLPTAARPSSLSSSAGAATVSAIPTSSATELSNWHHQANLSLLLSMAQSQPTDIDREQLSDYTTWRGRGRHRSRRFRDAPHHRLRTTTTENAQPLLQCNFVEVYHKWVVQFTGRVGQGDRCVRSNAPLPRPTLIASKDASWVLPPNGLHGHNNSHSRSTYKHYRGSGVNASLLDLFCRNARAVSAPRPAWRPFVAPFLSQQMPAAVHLTPPFVSYFEVSILEPKTGGDSSTTNNTSSVAPRGPADCVAVGLATDAFDWHARMPGWDASSYGYHGDDGGIFHSSGGMLRKFGPSYGRGDVVGCGVDHVAAGIFFTLNGEFLGYAWTDLPLEMLQKDLYPIVGVDTNDFVHCNYGTEPFVYDLKSMIVRHEDLVHQSLAASATSSRD